MLHARSFQNQKIDSFIRMLKFLIDGIDLYKPIVEPVIKDAHDLSVGRKDYFTIDRDDYHIIVSLVKKDKGYFETLDVSNLRKVDYEHILNDLIVERETTPA